MQYIAQSEAPELRTDLFEVQAGFYVKGVRLTNFTVMKLQLGEDLTASGS